MARLNEPPVAPGPSADSVEVVKRRYLRQNRELAKINSQQSIRIRNLENEGSRLLAENLSLREQVLQLQNTLEARSNRPSIEDIGDVKSRLETKLAEFGNLVAELGQLQKANRSPRCKSQAAATRRSPDERQWRSGLGLQAVENAMLPTIMEDKYFPRETMGADELQNMLGEPESQSPDIGPPPISRFDVDEPIPFQPNRSPAAEANEMTEETEPALLVNLEARKKRRESGPKNDPRRLSMFETSPEKADARPARSVRTGSKRKFSVQEDEDQEGQPKEADTFTFNRRNPSDTDAAVASSDGSRAESPVRPALANKPVNTDPVLSPKKHKSSSAKPEKKAPGLKTNRGRLTITRTNAPEIPPIPLPAPTPVAEIQPEPLPPKTPAVVDIFSPHSDKPSTSRPETKDTPPPADLNSNDQTGRPSRRARPQVSYKEPSLNTKMRRPGKELVDAVVATNRRSSVEPTSTVKREPEEHNSGWKRLPSVQGHESEAAEAGSPLREKLGRRDATQQGDTAPDPPRLNSSAASNAISALISATSTARRKTTAVSSAAPETHNVPAPVASKPLTAPDGGARATAEKTDDLAIFDFTDSSPNDPPLSRQRADLAKGLKTGRRHSSVPASSSTEERLSGSKIKRDEITRPSHSRSGSSSGIRSTSANKLPQADSRTGSKDKQPSGPPSGASQPDLQPSDEAISTASLRGERAERAASRRKSMML
ncbi:uncharacterized protein EI97DRAFT_384069 [Westerdykella ornata]|uniref:Shugoshin n=1 Tax=Westerdykella ornata TaxID=318751 RepID=A0A6A6JAC4_WESOR|nr:uncharacterized protein EI97DRAFT_384069 [Westerdykella ornata]KAF2273207.1 hypothetical protein EI97DRAFT_384069 [Westerdykella ornata]